MIDVPHLLIDVCIGILSVAALRMLLKGIFPRSSRLDRILFWVKKVTVAAPGAAFCFAGIYRFAELANGLTGTFDAYASAATVYGFGLIFLQFIEPGLKAPVILGVAGPSQNEALHPAAGGNQKRVRCEAKLGRYIIKIKRDTTRLNGVALGRRVL